MNYFLAIYLGISVITIFTNTPIRVVAAEIDKSYDISYVKYTDYNIAQNYYKHVAGTIEAEKQRQIEQKKLLDQQIAFENKQKLEQEQQQILQNKKAIKANKVAKAKVNATTVSYTAPSSPNSGSVADLIYYWTSVYGGDPEYHIKIARCESGLNPNSVGGRGLYLGVYQQHSKYWEARATRAGFSGASPFDANANVAVSIQMMRSGGYNHWGCA